MAWFKSYTLIIAQLLVLSSRFSSSLRTAPPVGSQGYEITVGIDPSSVVQDTAGYISRIWNGIENLSQEMFRATHGHFYIKSAQVIIPRPWSIQEDRETQYSYQTADIRISQTVSDPRAENPNACGLPGNFIELPLNFFDDGESQYGTPWKALLHLWARYRWGVWEEHGFAYSTRFPYSYLKPGENSWKPTGCSNVELVGEYKKLNSSEICKHDGEYPPGPDCRYFPDATNTAKSSLMHYHSLESITDFCDADTHNKESPNKQNTFCQQLSAWEVIEQSPEFGTGDMLDKAPPLEKILVKPIARPILYLLLDGGLTMSQDIDIAEIKGNITSYFREKIPEEVMATIGIFPSATGPSTVEKLLPLQLVKENLAEFEAAIDGYNPTAAKARRNFGRALEETINEVKSLKLDSGAVILVLKFGDGTLPGELPYEEKLVASLKESNIKVFAIEIQTSIFRPNVNFKNLVTQAEGDLVILTNPNSLRQMTRILNQVVSELKRPMSKFVNRQLFKGHVDGSSPPIPILHTGINQIHLTLTLEFGIDPTTVVVTHDSYRLQLTPRAEWDKANDLSRRVVYGGYFEVEDFMKDVIQVTVKYTCDPSRVTTCTGVLVVSGEILMQSEVDDLTVTVSTSAVNDVLDLNQPRPSTTPFAIFASIRDIELRPVMNIERVTATLQKVGNEELIEIELKDNGLGTPDTFVGDGIYSSVWIPPVQDEDEVVYRVWVTVYHNPSTDKLRDMTSDSGSENAMGRLMPVDQKFFCERGQCDGVSLTQYNSRVFSASDLVVVKSDVWATKREPAQILDFQAWAMDNYEIRLSWTAPVIFNDPTGVLPAESYELHTGNTLEEIAGGSTTGQPLPDPPGAPGTLQEHIYQGVAGETKYFAIVAKIGTDTSRLSRIVGVVTRESELITTTQLPPQPTTEPWTSTVPTSESPTVQTDSSSAGSSTTETTTETPVKYWYEKREAYITFSVFGGAVVLLVMGVFLYKFLSKRSMKRQGIERLP